MSTRARVALVSMPWAASRGPSLAIGLLTAIAHRAGVACDALHLNLQFANAIGADVYEIVAEDARYHALAEHFFAVDLFGVRRLRSQHFLRMCEKRLREQDKISMDLATLEVVRDFIVPAFLDQATQAILALDVEVVGFSCVFNQVMSSLALARRLKQQKPELTILLGGAAVHGEMGEAYARAFSTTIDHVFVGEADVAFREFLETFDSRDSAPADVAGVTVNGTLTRPAEPFAELDALPVPTFDAFFAQRQELIDGGAVLPTVRSLPFEGGRGCWWGAKHHCTFCGLNGEGMVFRAKSADRIVDELTALSQRYGHTAFAAADNILSHRAFADLLPQLAVSSNFELFFEIKANLNRDRAAALAAAGVRLVQPGIESLSNHVLGLMRKGVDAVQNIHALRLLAEFGIAAHYNILVGFPHERASDYEEMLTLIPSLEHLPPPHAEASIAIEIHRFSPYYRDAERLGVHGLRAAAYYRYLLPPDIGPPEDFAYVFDRDLSPRAPILRFKKRLDRAIASWARSPKQIVAILQSGAVRIDREHDGVSEILDDGESLVFVAADAPTSIATIERLAAGSLRGQSISVRRALRSLVQKRLVAEANGRVVHTVPFRTAHTNRQLAEWLSDWNTKVSCEFLGNRLT